MKNIFFCISFCFLLIHSLNELYAQDRTGYYKLKCNIKIHYGEGDYCGGCNDHRFEYAFVFANTASNVANNFCLPNGNYYTTINDSIIYPYNKPVVKIKTEVWGRFDRNWFGSCSNYNNKDSFPVINYNADCISQNITSIVRGSGQLSDHTNNDNTATVFVQPIIKLFPDNAMDQVFPSDDNINIRASTGFYYSTYNWKFSIDNGSTWLSFPSQYLNQDSIRLNATTLLNSVGLNVNDYIEKNILVKIIVCNGTADSDILTYRITKSPPHFTSIAQTPVTCFDNRDGTMKLSFDRALLSQELLHVQLYDVANPSGMVTAFDTDTLSADRSFLIPYSFAPGRYFFKYNATTYLPNGDPSLSNLISTDTIEITAPPPVAFTTSKTDVWCYGGSDGIIQLNATGGVGNYQYMIKREGQPDSLWYNFSAAASHSITALPQGGYTMQVRDGNTCMAKTAAYGPIVNTTVTLIQPTAPLQINEVQKVNPTAYGYSNGYVVADIAGGTGNTDGSYNYEWKKLNGAVITTGITASITGSGYRLRLDNLADGTYILNTTDRNKASATTAQGCMATDTFVITQPLPLKVKFEIRDSILCNNDANGTLVAHGQGGIPFAQPASPYQYTWKKKDAGNVYQPMTGYTDSVAEHLSTGWYAVNITDANGITLVSDSLFFLPEPLQLMVSLDKANVTCSGMPNGAVTSTVSGGTVPYSYNWSTGETTIGLNNIPAGTYMVWVEDYHGCQVQKNIVVSQPNDIQLQVTKQSPTCNNGADGFINVATTGGTTPFTYNWTGSSSITNVASNLRSGNYSLKIIDANGCNIIHNDTLANPDPLPLDLGPDRYICSAQQMNYDITIPGDGAFTYTWTSNVGFTSNQPKVTLSQAGTYYATVKDANNCSSTDMLVLTAINTKVNNEFALPTQGYNGEKIVIANLSVPQADSVKWTFPAKATVVSQSPQMAEMILQDTGAYYVSLRAYKGLCYADQQKKIIINKQTNLPDPGTARNPFIVSFTAAPIPNTGSFTVHVELQEAAQIELKLINITTSQIISLGRQSGADKYAIPVNMLLTSGTYVLLLETPRGRETLKILVL